VDGLLGTARESLAGAIQDGFLFVLVATILSVAGAFFMENLRLEKKPAETAPEEATATSVGVRRELPVLLDERTAPPGGTTNPQTKERRVRSARRSSSSVRRARRDATSSNTP